MKAGVCKCCQSEHCGKRRSNKHGRVRPAAMSAERHAIHLANMREMQDRIEKFGRRS